MAVNSTTKRDLRTTLIQIGFGAFVAINCAAGFANAWFLYKPPSVVAIATVAPALVFAVVVLARRFLLSPDDSTSGTRMYAFTLCVLLAINLVGLGRIGSIFAGPYRHNVRFETPDGWKRLPLDRKTMIAWMVSPQSDPEAPVAMIMIEAGACGDKGLKEAVDGWVAKSGNKKISEETDLAGVPAFRIQLDRQGKRVQPIEAILAVHGKNLFMIIAGVDDSNPSYKDALEQIRKTWEWASPDAPPKDRSK